VPALPPLLVIAGATATGKTGLAVRLADELWGRGVAAEIISADSRQVYRGLDIGTAKVGRQDRARIPHHGLDLVDPDAPFSVADFVDHASASLARIAGRGGLAILVGGTGLYLRAIARGLDTEALPSDAVVRARIEDELLADKDFEQAKNDELNLKNDIKEKNAEFRGLMAKVNPGQDLSTYDYNIKGEPTKVQIQRVVKVFINGKEEK